MSKWWRIERRSVSKRVTKLFVDANLFLRYLTNDVPEQADAVEKLLDQAEAGEVALVTNSHVIAELVWVLSSFYKLERQEVRERLLGVVQTPGLRVVEEPLVLEALQGFVEKNVDYIDAYNAAWMRAEGLEEVATFDRKHFNRFEHLRVRVPGRKE